MQASKGGGAGGAGGLELDSPECFYALLSQPVEAAAVNEIDLDDDDETGVCGGGALALCQCLWCLWVWVGGERGDVPWARSSCRAEQPK